MIAGGATIASAQFVNGDFGTGDFTGWTVNLTSGGANAIQDVVSYDIDGPGPLDLSNVGRFSVGRATGVTTGNHGILLTQDMTLAAGLYDVEFDWSAFRTVTTSNTQGGIFELIVDGAVIATAAAGSTSSTNPHFGHLFGSFESFGGTHTVGVQITRPFTIPSPTDPNLFQVVDNFAINPVPEPATLAMLSLGFAAIARRRLRKK